MLLTLIALLLIVLLTLFLATQGALTAVLQLVTAVFASLLALALYEVVAPFLADTRAAEYAHGVAFLGVFFLAFAVLRVTADQVVPQNVVLPLWVDRILGGGVGLLAALILVGTTIVGVEMLPVEERLLSFSGAVVEHPTFPDSQPFAAGVVTWMYGMVSGRSLLGARLETVHPDLGTELTGYRHTVTPGARHTLSPELVQATDVYEADEGVRKVMRDGIDAAASQAINDEIRAAILKQKERIEEPGKRVLVVRTWISRGTEPPKVAVDVTANSGDLLLLTPPQVRLVAALVPDFAAARAAKEEDRKALVAEAGSFKQYYPVGMLQGKTYQALDLATGYVAQRYGEHLTRMAFDWVFVVDDQALPTLLEIKQGGRAALLGALRTKAPVALEKAQMGEDAVAAQAATLRIVVQYNGNPAPDAEVLVVSPVVQNRAISSFIDDVYRRLADKQGKCEENQEGWLASPSNPNVPGTQDFMPKARDVRDFGGNAPPELPVEWSKIVPAALMASLSTQGAANLDLAERCFEQEIRPRLKSVGKVLAEKKTDAAGRADDLTVPGRECTVIVKYQSGGQLLVAITKAQPTAQKTDEVKVSLTPVSADAFHLPLR